MKNLTTGLLTFFNSVDGSGNHNTFYNDIPGRFFDDNAEGILLSDGPYAQYFIVSNVDFDTWSENMADVYFQISLFSGASSSQEIKDMETHLTDWLKDKTFPVTSETVVHAKRLQSDGPYTVPADTELGTGKYRRTDVDFVITINRS